MMIMNYFTKAMDKEKSSLGFKSLRRVTKVSDHQNGKTDIARDLVRKALKSGKRTSASGKVYYEYRKNRTDMKDGL